MQPCFDGPFGTAHHIGDFGATEIFLVEQKETETVIVPQLANGGLQLVGKLARLVGAGRDRLVEVQRSTRIPGPLF